MEAQNMWVGCLSLVLSLIPIAPGVYRAFAIHGQSLIQCGLVAKALGLRNFGSAHGCVGRDSTPPSCHPRHRCASRLDLVPAGQCRSFRFLPRPSHACTLCMYLPLMRNYTMELGVVGQDTSGSVQLPSPRGHPSIRIRGTLKSCGLGLIFCDSSTLSYRRAPLAGGRQQPPGRVPGVVVGTYM